MRTLTSKERMLATVLGTVLFLVLNLAGVRWIAAKIRDAKAKIVRLEAENASLREVLLEKPEWLARKAWITEHPLEVYNANASGSQFVEAVRQGVTKQGLTLKSLELLNEERTGAIASALVRLQMQGSMQDITRWIHGIQQPGGYQFLRSFKLKKGEDGNSMELVVVLGKVFTTSELAISP